MPILLFGLAIGGALALDYLTRPRMLLGPASGFEDIDPSQKESVFEQRDTFVNECIRKNSAWYEPDFDVKVNCQNAFWSAFNEKFEKNGGVYSIK